MNVKMLVCMSGEEMRNIGDVVSVSKEEAERLIDAGFAAPVEEMQRSIIGIKKEKAVPQNAGIETTAE